MIVPYRDKGVVQSRVRVKTTPEECKKKILRSSPKDTECFKIDLEKACNQYCLKLGKRRCGSMHGGDVVHYQCKNKSSGPRKACCCEFNCNSPNTSKKEARNHQKRKKKRIKKRNQKRKQESRFNSKETLESPGFGAYGDPFDPEIASDGHLKKRR